MSTPPPAQAPVRQNKHACSVCARRKIRCDRTNPCSNCVRTQLPCSYETPPAPRQRKRAADEDLLARLTQYEDLMRKHNVDFAPHSHTWVTSGLEPEASPNERKRSSSAHLVPIPSGGSEPNTRLGKAPETQTERCLWSTLSSDLRYPSMQTLWHENHMGVLAEMPLHQLVYGSRQLLHELHPQPKHIYRFWQIFVESVNPLLKFVHAPSLQKRVLDASWDLGSVSKPLAAILFAIYTLAVITASPEECQTSFGETKEALVRKYRTASFQALVEVDFLTTRDFEVLQAFVLFLFAEPDSELTSTLTCTAIRLGQKMGLHQNKTDPKVSVFEREMHIRLWWQLNGLDARVRSNKAPGMKMPPSESEFGNVRPPLNVNDADLHPEMAELPLEHSGPTEMLAVLMKFEIYRWYQSSPIAARLFSAIAQGLGKGASPELTEEAIEEIEARYEDNFLRHLDLSIPLHRLTHAMAKLSVARMRFKVYHPRGRAATVDGEAQIARHDSDVTFHSAVTWIEMVEMALQSGFAPHLIRHFTSMYTIDAYIYVISELRRRTAGPLVNLAWKLIDTLYSTNPHLVDDSDNKIFCALGDLTLDAWERRREELARSQDVQSSDVTPPSIQALWNKRRGTVPMLTQQSYMADVTGLDDLDFSVDVAFNWDHWNDFLRP